MAPVAPRAGILVTGTEVLTGIISDRNGPWVSERLRELGVDAAMIEIVGDRPEDLLAALERMRDAGLALVVTSGGLGPTADDLTADVVGRFCGREMALDEPLAGRIAEIVAPMMSRWPDADPEAMARANRKQAVVPVGATVLPPVGTAPGLVVTPASGEGPTVVVLPGPPRELAAMWETAVAADAFRAAMRGATEYRREIMRLYGLPEAQIAATLEAAVTAGLSLDGLEITTCLRRGEVEIATRYEPGSQAGYDALLEFVRERHRAKLFSPGGATIDEIIAGLLSRPASAGGGTLAVAESCTAGLLAARVTARPGSSAYFLGGGVVYSDEAKTLLAGVPAPLIASTGAVSVEVAAALASGIAASLGADYGVGITGIAGPGGGSEDKPVGLVCISVHSARDGRFITRAPRMPGGRDDIRDRSVTVALHLLRRLLLGEADDDAPGPGGTPA